MATLGLSEAERETVERFEAEVIAPSMTQLVILDFWAEWCGPCKQLGPLLDKIASEYSAKGVKLVKIDVDSDKLLAAQFQIQSIPTVYAIHRGQPVADLTNARSEGQLRQVLDQLLAKLNIVGDEAAKKEQVAPLLAMGEQVLGDGDAERAVSILKQVREIAPDDPATLGALARALIAAGRLEQARALVDGISDSLRGQPEIERASAALALASSEPAGNLAELEAAAAATPDDPAARFALAEAQLAAGNRDAAADSLLAVIAFDRDWEDGKARARFLQMLAAAGLEDPWSGAQRRRLSALLFT